MTLKNTDCYDIIITNKQTIDNEKDTIEEKVSGKYYIRNGKKYIIYKNPEVSTMIIVDEKEIIIRRKGNVSSDMHYRCGRKTSFKYRMPYGSVDMEIDTEKVVDALFENGGTLHIVYTLIMQSGRYNNNMKITVSEREDK